MPTQNIQAQNQLNNLGLPATTASAAFSFRKVTTGYTGAIIKVRRSIDNAEADIYFDAGNELSGASSVRFIQGITLSNTNSFITKTGTISITNGSKLVNGIGTNFTSLAIGDILVSEGTTKQIIGTVASITDNVRLTLVDNATINLSGISYKVAAAQSFGTFYSGAATNCFVKTWYDQSGNNKNAAQVTNTSQPIIVESGAIKTLNGKPILIWDSFSKILECDVSTTVQTVNAVRNLTSTGNTAWQTLFASPKNTDFSVRNGYTQIPNGNDWVNNTGTTPTNWVNGVQTLNGTTALHTLTASSASSINNTFSISSSFMNRGLTSNIGVSEMILFSGFLPETTRQVLECSQFNYFTIANTLPTIANQNTAICSGKAFFTNTNNGNTNIRYSWSLPVISPVNSITGSAAQLLEVSECSQVLTNITNNAATATYTVTPSLCGISGNPFTVTVTVNPLPVIVPVITPDYCSGNGFVKLTSSPGLAYLWSTGQTTQSINVANAGTYSVSTNQNPYGCASAQSINVAQELVVNGNFDAGATGFTTSYINNQSSIVTEGTYAVKNNASLIHHLAYGKDHTTGTGNFMIVNGKPAPAGANVWSQDNIAVQPNTTYYFSAWALTVINGNNAVLQFSINGFQTGTIAYLPNGYTNNSGPFTWVRIFGQWNSGPSTSVNLRIVDLNTSSGGNDFGLDDISFGTLSPVGLSATPTKNAGNAACLADTLFLNSNVMGGASPYTYLWEGPNSFSSNQKNPLVSPSANALQSGTYRLKITDGVGCKVDTSITVNIAALPANKLTTASNSTLCVGGQSNIILETSQTGVSYLLKNAANQAIGDPASGNGTNIFLSTGMLSSTETFSIVAITDNTGCNVTMTNPITVTVATTPVLKITNQAVCSGTVNLTLATVTAGSTSGGSLSYWADASATSALPTPSNIITSGIYYIKSTIGSCSDIEPVVISISASPSAAFNYTGSPFCNNSNNPFPNITGVAGTFTSSPVGLVFVNTSTGQINLAASTPGTYTVKNTVGCTNTFVNQTVTIKALPKVGFCYGATNDLCQSINVANQLPSLEDATTSATGTFASTTGLNITASTGAINIGTSTPGNYAIWRTIPASGGCPSVADTIFLDINPYTNSGIVLTDASDNTICNGASINLYATPLPYLSVLFREKFNSGGFSWIKTNNSSAGTPALASWTSRANSYNDGSATYNSNDNSNFFFTSSILQGLGSTTETILTSASMSTIGFSTLRLDFFHYFKRAVSGIAIVEVSTNNSSWTPILTYNTSQGANNAFKNEAVNLDGYIGQANFYIRFKYNGQYDGSWSIDNISLTGNSSNYTYGWSSFPAGFASSAGSPTVTPSSNSFYVLTAINSYGCSQPALPVPVSVFATQTLNNIQQPTVACAGSGTNITLTGLVPGNISTVSYSINGIAQTPIAGVVANASGIASFTSINLTAANNGNILMLTALDNGYCTATFSTSLTINVQTQITWSGEISNNWFDVQNWCGGIPTSSTNILVPSGLGNYPVLTTGTGSVKDITIQNNASLIINGGKLTVSGAIVNTGTFNALNGNVEMNGTVAQGLSGNLFTGNTIKSLNISNTSETGLTISNTAGNLLKVKETLSFGVSNATLNTGDNLVLLSSLTGTARVSDITNNGVNSGNKIVGLTTVERYFPSRRSWRLITAPLSSNGSTATIFSDWQNNGNYLPGIGTLITGNGAPANGLDVSANNSFSLKKFQNNTYVNVVDTKIPFSDTTAVSAANVGYFMFVRGDRDLLNFTLPHSNTTTLSSKGKLQYGPQTFPAHTRPSGDANRYFTLIGNPYASPVDFNSLTRVNLLKRFIVCDPNLGTGAFVTFDDVFNNGNFVSSLPMSYTEPIDKNIQSGQAFFVETGIAAGAASITFNESNKSVINKNSLFRPTEPVSAVKSSFRSILYILNSDNSTKLADGNLAEFNNSFNNSVDVQDALKFSNVNENFALLRSNTNIAMERRQPVTDADTLFFNLSRTTQRNYRFEFQPTDFETNLIAVIEDSYLGTRTSINLFNNTTYDFIINRDVKSAAANRFRIVFSTIPLQVLPVTFKTVRAYQQTSDIVLDWIVENEINISTYEVEKSLDGIHFEKVKVIMANGLNSGITNYKWLDVLPVVGNNFYRIKSVNADGKSKYSAVCLVKLNNALSGIRVYPNPITNGIIGIEFKNIPGGSYAVRLLNENGQTIFTNVINHATGNTMEYIQPNYKMNAGIYQMELTAPDKNIKSIMVIVK